ncbi:MAG: QueT transporter family protein [Bacilli bacterium]|nr:QueT transporter family protein [Bacilli bacterium]
MKKDITKDLVLNACICAIYVVMTVAVPSFSYDYFQLRISEALILLCFYNKKYSFGILSGCFIANLVGPFGIIDAIFGTLSTGLAVILMIKCKNAFVASLMPTLTVFIVALEIAWLDGLMGMFWMIYASVALGEFIVLSVIGLLIFKAIEKNKWLCEQLDFNK